jgi:hypothetical protein
MFFKRRHAGRDAARPARLPADAAAGAGRPGELAGTGPRVRQDVAATRGATVAGRDQITVQDSPATFQESKGNQAGDGNVQVNIRQYLSNAPVVPAAPLMAIRAGWARHGARLVADARELAYGERETTMAFAA